MMLSNSYFKQNPKLILLAKNTKRHLKEKIKNNTGKKSIFERLEQKTNRQTI